MRTKVIKLNDQYRAWNIDWQYGIRAGTFGTSSNMVTNKSSPENLRV